MSANILRVYSQKVQQNLQNIWSTANFRHTIHFCNPKTHIVTAVRQDYCLKAKQFLKNFISFPSKKHTFLIKTLLFDKNFVTFYFLPSSNRFFPKKISNSFSFIIFMYLILYCNPHNLHISIFVSNFMFLMHFLCLLTLNPQIIFKKCLISAFDFLLPF